MSLYQQAQGYGQAYPPQISHTYMQVPPPGIYAHPFPQAAYPVHFTDPSSFRRDYTTRLSELTVNSRPIIQNLSMMAQNYVRYADIVAECLQVHIHRVPPWMKLPAFYVLDAISKNVYDPYASKFSAFVVPLFLETYGQVDASVRSKMEEMLVTWRTGSPSGKELFGVAPQVSLERQIWGNDTSSIIESSSRRGGPSPPLTKSQVLAELDVTLALKEQASSMNPYDSSSKNHVSVLQQLRRMVEMGVSQDELKQILTQLRAMARETSSAPPPPPPQPQPTYTASQHSVPQLPAQYSQSQVNQPPSYSSYGAGLSVPVAQQPVQIIPSNGATLDISQSAPTTLSGISDLFKSLVKAGLVSSSNMPVGANSSSSGVTALSTGDSSATAIETPEEAIAKKLEDEKREVQRAYAKKILGMKIRLVTSDVSRQRPQNVASLYQELPLQCKQCAMRFPVGSAGKKRMEDHLDMHFRQNRRAKETIGRGYSRSWFISINDWLSEHDVKGKGRDVSRNANGKTIIASEMAEREAALRASFVVVPPGEEVKTINCPVCKETLRSEFREEDEEWIWQNAVRVKDKIYHATCHAEMLTSSTLAAKLRAETIATSGSSRSGTPERSTSERSPKTGSRSPKSPKTAAGVSKSPTPERVALGLKRKAEDESTEDGLRETPPLKKTAA